MSRLPLRWAAGDVAKWRGLEVRVEYVSADRSLAMITYAAGLSLRCAIVSAADLDLRWSPLS